MQLPASSSDAQSLPRKHTRDHRVDALRGAALLMMLADHVPDNLINRITIRNFGFADAAEIFVMLAGYASYLAYGRLIDATGGPAVSAVSCLAAPNCIFIRQP